MELFSVEGDEECIGPSGKFLCLLQNQNICSSWVAIFQTCLTLGPILLLISFYLRAPRLFTLFHRKVSKCCSTFSFLNTIALFYPVWTILKKNKPWDDIFHKSENIIFLSGSHDSDPEEIELNFDRSRTPWTRLVFIELQGLVLKNSLDKVSLLEL